MPGLYDTGGGTRVCAHLASTLLAELYPRLLPSISILELGNYKRSLIGLTLMVHLLSDKQWIHPQDPWAEKKGNRVLTIMSEEDWDNPKQDALVKLPRPVALVP